MNALVREKGRLARWDRLVLATAVACWFGGVAGPARADEPPVRHRLVVKVQPPSAGQASGGGMFDTGTAAPVVATPSAGFTFFGWAGGGVANPAAASTTVLLDADREVTAVFRGTFAGEVESYIDVDPGRGNGTAVAVVNGSANFVLNTAGLAEGTHTLFLRARPTAGEWGPPMPHPFTVEAMVTGEEVEALESYVDADPGRGLAVPVVVTSGVLGTDPQVGARISLAGKNPGTRVIGVRARGPAGIWGPPNPFMAAVESSDRFEWPTQLEYAWDPAGTWTSVAVQTPGNLLAQVAISPDLSALGPGTRLLYLRGVDSSGSRGVPFSLPVAIVPGSLTGSSPPPAKLVTYLQNAGGVVAGSYRETPLNGFATPLHHSFTLSLTGMPAGQAADVAAHVVNQAGGTSPTTIATFTVVVNGTNGYAAWKNTPGYFTTEEKADEAVSGIYADPDVDGVPNVLELALGTHPRQSSAGAAPQTTRASGKMLYTFRQLTGGSGHRAFNYTANGVRYTVEWSRGLGTDWGSGGDEAFQVKTVTSNGDGTDTVTVQVDSGITDNQARTFLRLKITLL